MSGIDKNLLCSLTALAISAVLNIAIADENEHEKLEAEEPSFALWGDIPYAKNGDAPKIQALIDDINASNVSFRIDIKHCTLT